MIDISRDLTEDVLFKLYIEEKKTTTEIAKIFGYSSSQTISNKLKKFNIPARQKSEENVNKAKMKEERVGLTKKNKFGLVMEIIEYNGTRNILVKFEKGEPIRAEWSQFLKGTLRSPYEKTIFGVGFIGEGKYRTKINGKHFPQYSIWRHMLRRAYSEEYHEKYPTYIGCNVVDKWYNYNTFCKWYDENYYEIDGERMELDKDILIKGNKTYSPDTCVFVPQSINYLFTKRDSCRGDLPIGVHWDKNLKKYRAQCMNGKGNKKALGQYDTTKEAFHAYKTYKENLIKQIANEYKDKIPLKLYEAMMKYEVEIND